MINGNIINGNVINGSGLNEVSKLISDSVNISEIVSKSTHFQKTINENISVIDSLLFKLTKGMSELDSIKITETLDILISISSKALFDSLKISETQTFLLQKEVLMNDYIQYYLDLLIIQYKNKTRITQHMTTIIKAGLIDLMWNVLNNAFNIETAEGVQLDILGKYIGVSRRVKTFSMDETLNDSDYRYLLKIKRSLNNIGSSFYDIKKFLNDNFSGIILAYDHKDMTMSFIINSSIIGNTLAQAIVEQNLLPVPMGVGHSEIVYIPTVINIFSFRSYTFQSGAEVGFNRYSSFHPEYRFLNYGDTL